MTRPNFFRFLVFVSIIILYPMLNSISCIDTLRDDRGIEFINTQPQREGIDYKIDEILVKLDKAAFALPHNQNEAIIKDCPCSIEIRDALKYINANKVVKVFTNLLSDDTLRIVDDSIRVIVPDLSNIYRIQLYPGMDEVLAVEYLCGIEGVLWAELNTRMLPLLTPHDPMWDMQWNLYAANYGIDCERAWESTAGKRKIKIGFIGSGIDAAHPDLLGKVAGGHNYHVPIPPGDPWGDDGVNLGHETKVAGIAGARTNNNLGISGIAGGWNSGLSDIGAEFYSLRGTDNSGVMYVADMANAVVNGGDYCDCDIINISWGSHTNSFTLRNAIEYSRIQKRIIIAAMGDEGNGNNSQIFPAEYEDIAIIAVGSYGQDGHYCVSYGQNGQCPLSSDYDYPMDFLAPGANISTTAPGSTYDIYFGGTSAAAPHVAGVAALILSAMPSLAIEDIEWLLSESANDAGNPGYDERYGWGRVNAGNVFNDYINSHYSNGSINNYITIESNPVLTDLAHTTWRFFGESSLDEGRYYEVICKQAIYYVAYPETFESISGVWGKSINYSGGYPLETEGWSASNPNYTFGYCEVIPGSEYLTGCAIKTYFFNVNVNGNWRWYPRDPTLGNQICYSVWGIKSDGNPTRPDGGKLEESEDRIPVYRVFPNPFNSQITFQFTITTPTFLILKIYDISGKRIATETSYIQVAGENTICWKAQAEIGHEIPSGIYFATLETGESQVSLKIMLVK